MRKYRNENKRKLYLILSAGIAFAIFTLFMKNEQLLEVYYTFFFRPVSFVLNFLFSFTYFSVGEILLYLVLGFLVYLLLKEITHLIRRRKISFRKLLNSLTGLLATVSAIYILFMLLFGLNYYHKPFASENKFSADSISVDELAAVTRILSERMNTLRKDLQEDTNGVMKLQKDYKYYLRKGKTGYTNVAEMYNLRVPTGKKAKRLIVPSIFSYMGVGGVFFPHTFEANVNMSVPDPYIPAIVCHELAHSSGYATEDEANYISFITSRANSNPEFRYSGYLMAFTYFNAQLALANQAEQKAIVSSLYNGVIRDIRAYQAFWAQYKSPAGKVSSAIYNQYLKANNQEKGIMSYHEMVKLVISEYRKYNDL